MYLDPVFGWILSLAIAQLFASAAWHKFKHRAHFKQVLNSYQLLSLSWVGPMALLLLAAESIAAVTLLLPPTRSWGGLLSALLMLLYAGAMAINLYRGRRLLDCGCHFRGRKEPISGFLVIRNVLIACSALLLVLPVSERALGFYDIGVVLFGLTVCSLIFAIGSSLTQTSSLLNRS